jgi:hypothetical protein
MSHAESAAAYAEARQQVERRWRTAFENSKMTRNSCGNPPLIESGY